jgi:hypothetical protein
MSMGGAKVVPSYSVVAEQVRFLAVPHLAFEMPVRLVWVTITELGLAFDYESVLREE